MSLCVLENTGYGDTKEGDIKEVWANSEFQNFSNFKSMKRRVKCGYGRWSSSSTMPTTWDGLTSSIPMHPPSQLSVRF